jgi:hypothetical protein
VVAALTEKARSIRRENILAAIVDMMLLVYSTFYVASCSK